MARKAVKKPNENIAQKIFKVLVKKIAWTLSLVGKPLYAVLVISIKAAGFLHTATKSNKFLRRRVQRSIKPKPEKEQFPSIKIEKLRLQLFGITILTRLKRLFSKRLTKFQKLTLKRKFTFLLFILSVTAASLYFYLSIIKDLPSPKELTQKSPQVSTKIYDRNGNLLYKIFRDENRTIIPLSQIPIHVRLATLAAEDAEFYDHPGFSLKGITRAVIQDIINGTLHGGSTITQQLVKNVLLTPEKTFSRKLKEIILSIEVEATYTKDQILEMYLNQVSYGGTAYGIEEASQEYFGKNTQELDLAEAAFLAGLPKSPTIYSPYGPNPELGIERQREVLRLMVINKYITAQQELDTRNQKLVFVPHRNSIKAPHFVMYIRKLLVDKYGEEMVEKGGLEVTTSLDLNIQEFAQKIVSEEIEKLKKLNVGNGAALVINPKTGEVLAMVGSADYFDSKNDGQVNVTLRLRQPGSSIKVVNYAYAISKGGYTAATIINDSPITYSIPGSPPYSPVNYDGQYRGNITLRSALAQSRNIPAVKVLASYGVDRMVSLGQQMGITSWTDPSKFGLSLTLGGGAVTSLDLARVYSTLANSGKTPEIQPILQVKNYQGKLLEKNQPKYHQTLDQATAFIITDILKDNNARAPEFGFNSYLVIKNHPEVAVKTGTSNDLRDNWTAGYNQNYLVITWVGNNDNSTMSKIASGVTGASPIWNKIITGLLLNKPSYDWPVPANVVKINCPSGKSEWFNKDNILKNYCSPPLPTASSNTNTNNAILDGASTINR